MSSAVNPTIAAAVIAAGSTVFIAVVSVCVSAWTTVRTLDTTRLERLWDKRAEVYEEILAYSAYRKDFRENQLRTLRYSPEIEVAIKRVRDEYKPPPWNELQGRVLAFGSHKVIDAFKEAHDADDRVLLARSRRGEELVAMTPGPSLHLQPDEVRRVSKEIEELADKTEQTDAALISQVRRELLGRWRRPRKSHIFVRPAE